MTDAPAQPAEPSASPDPDALLVRDIRLTWRTLFALGIPEPYLMELCVDALLSVPRGGRGYRLDDTVSPKPVYEGAVMHGAHFGRGFVDRREVPAQLGGIALETEVRELLQALSDGLVELTMAEQESFRLFEVEGFSLEEIGEMLSISSDFAKAQLQAARRRLRRSRAAAGRPIQRAGLFAMMRVWHNPDDDTVERVRTAAIKALARDDAGGRYRWLGPTVAVLLSTALLVGLWLVASSLSGNR